MMDSSFLIGTAGHVDHGKTTLVQALTGINTDRLEEERRRGMSIELGFAEFRLPSGRSAGIVDVPGHERFLKNMLAGATGVDFALLVVAADEGVMPQTREHLAILQSLRIPAGVVAITKCDTVEPEWLTAVSAEVRQALAGTFLADAPLIETDAVSGRGLEELVRILDETSAQVPAPDLDRPAFLCIDRVFIRPGFGPVVTGSLRSGVLRVGDAVTVYPDELPARVRGLQTFGETESTACAGMRAAVNLSGVSVDELHRGQVLASTGSLQSTDRLNVFVELAEGDRPLKHRTRARLHIGTAEILVRILLWESAEVAPGGSAYAQLRLETPTASRRGDRFVLRWYSPQNLMGGGEVLEANPKPFRSRDAELAERLRALAGGTSGEVVLATLSAMGLGAHTPESVAERAGVDVADVVRELENSPSARKAGTGWVSAEALNRVGEVWTERLKAYHKSYPLRTGMPPDELRKRTSPVPDERAFEAIVSALEQDRILERIPGGIRLPGFEVRLRLEQEKAAREISSLYESAGWQPPFRKDVTRSVGPHRATAEVWEYLVSSGELAVLEEGLCLHRTVVQHGLDTLRRLFDADGQVTVGSFRDATGSSRRTAVPFLEWCDSQRFTRRVEDARVPGSRLSRS